MIFNNYQKVANNRERKLILKLIGLGIDSVRPRNFMKKSLSCKENVIKVGGKEFDLKNKRIFVIGAGKMAGGMAIEIEKILGYENITHGIINTNFCEEKPKKITVNKADHPIPSLKGLRGAKKILEMKKKFNLGKKDFIITLISGGGSSLLPYPIDEISFDDKKKMIIELIKSGADVQEMTILKKKLSKVKGGKLAEYFYPTPILSLVVSDVVGDDLEVIASGPLTKDNSTFKDALDIIEKYNLRNKIPEKVERFLVENKNVSEKQNLSHVAQFILANNQNVIKTIKNCARNLGLKVEVIKNVKGESSSIAQDICNKLNKTEVKKPTLFIYGGETTVTLGDSSGKGGRNQEFITSCLKHFNYKKFNNYNWAIASIATDGMDYIKESCGGIIDRNSFEIIEKNKINLDKYLHNHNSHSLLKKINSNLSTDGLTGINVGDVMLFLFA